MWDTFLTKAQSYHPIPISQPHHQSRSPTLITIIFISTIILVLTNTASFLLGTHHPVSDYNLLTPAGTILHPFHYNRPFGQAPSEESESWWRRIFPSTLFSHLYPRSENREDLTWWYRRSRCDPESLPFQQRWKGRRRESWNSSLASIALPRKSDQSSALIHSLPVRLLQRSH